MPRPNQPRPHVPKAPPVSPPVPTPWFLPAGTFHGDVVDGELEAAPAPHHAHRVPLVVVQLLPREERLGAFAWGAGVSQAAPRHGDTGTRGHGDTATLGDTGGHRDTGDTGNTATPGDTRGHRGTPRHCDIAAPGDTEQHRNTG